MQPFARASSASARLCPPSHGHSPPAFRPYLPDLGSLWLSKQPHKLFLNIKIVRIILYSPPFCGVSRAVADHHLCSQCILCFAHARTRTGVHCPCLHSHSHFGVSADRQKHHRSRLRCRTHCAARAAALRVVDRTDGFTTRPPSDLSWYLPRASSQRRGLPSSCVAHKFSFLRRGQILCR